MHPAALAAVAETGFARVHVLQAWNDDTLVGYWARRGQMLKLAEHPRPFLSSVEDRKRSGSTAKKLRQDWNRLSALGAVDVANDRSGDDIRAAFEIFLEMELRSWKGQNGTALLSD